MAVSLSISITQNSQSVANNTSNVTVKVVAKWTGGSYNKLEKSGWLKIDGTKYTFTSPFNTGQSTSGSATLFTKTLNISHNTNGSKTLSCSASYTTGVSSGTITASASKTLTTIKRKSVLSVSNGTLGTSQTLTVTRYVSSYTHSIRAQCGNAAVYVKADGSIGYTESLCRHNDCSIPFAPPLIFASENTTGTSVSITYTITTYNGSTAIGSNTKTVTYSIPASVKPSCSISVTDPTGNFDKYGFYIQNKSKFKVVVTPNLAYGSPIAKYITYAFGLPYTTASFTTAVIPYKTTISVLSMVTDKRGRSSETVKGTNSYSFTPVEYSNPSITDLTVHRCNADGTANDKGGYVKTVFSARLSNLNGLNSAKYSLKYKKTTEEEYTAISLSDYNGVYALDNATYIFAADTGSSYDIRVEATDDFETTIKTTSVSTAFTLMHWKASGLGLGIGKISELDNVLDVGLQTRHNGGILPPVLEPETDLNDVKISNIYVGANLDTYNYANCPITKGTFTLDVTGAGEEGQVKQRLTVCSKEKARTWERFYYQNAWGEWVCVSDYGNTLLWSGAYYMQASHEIALAEKISKQPSGIVLVFSRYMADNGGTLNQQFQFEFVPKKFVEIHGGSGITVMLTSAGNFSLMAAKYLYIHDDKIVGHDNNTTTGTGACGVTYKNNGYVLRYVIGV